MKLKKVSLMILLVLIMVSLFGCSEKVDNDNVSKYKSERQENWTSINDEIFVSTGEFYEVNLILVTSGDEATLIDTGYKLPEAEAVKKYIEDNNLTLKNIIITHGHADHDTNIDMFIDDNINLYQYSNSKDNQVIEMGDKQLKIVFTPGHYFDLHMSVEIDKKILVAGDIISTNVSPIELLKSQGNKEKLIETLEGLQGKDYSLIIPGHGEVCIGDSIIDDHLKTLKESK